MKVLGSEITSENTSESSVTTPQSMPVSMDPDNFLYFMYNNLRDANSFEKIFYQKMDPKKTKAAGNVNVAGKRLAEVLCYFIEKNYVSISDIHIVGHSLGPHFSGAAVNDIYKCFGRKLERVSEGRAEKLLKADTWTFTLSPRVLDSANLWKQPRSHFYETCRSIYYKNMIACICNDIQYIPDRCGPCNVNTTGAAVVGEHVNTTYV
ncbi:unnamed protein product [Allacma fusca]|uniref:Lipase domain-containing protein n=1 Tax=Allacma fusca TaxID=39272 RepID=A0A8J2P272_9HEXA|nr:unnamed protein product [Allacma fusca]